jgi:HEAT repeat protein
MMSTARIRAGSILRESMSQASQLSPELARGLLHLARALLAAVRNWTIYPPEHPTVGASVSRLADAVRQSSLGAVFSLGVTPETLLIEGTPADTGQTGIAEAAALLHDRDLLQVTFIGDVSTEALHAFLRVLTLDTAERRQRGGPAQIWQTEGHSSIALEQIDYQKMLAREEGEVPEAAKRDDLWRSIVLSITSSKTLFDEREQQRLLAIAGSADDIGDLATAVMAPKCTLDGSPMITSQAATVMAAFRHLTSIVSVKAAERMPDVMNNMATAVMQLDPHVVMQVMQSEDDPTAATSVVQGLAGAFDDTKVAQLLATALALDGQASDRLATIFSTIAPDEDRKRRVLTMTRSMLSETDFGKAGQFQALWSSMEELLVSYNDKPFVSEAYRSALDGVGTRAERMAAVDLPPELPQWMDSLGQDNVRGLSVQLLIDLLTIEEDATRAAAIAADMEALSEDLLMAGAYGDTESVTKALAARAQTPGAMGRDACRLALDQLGESIAMRETIALLDDIDEAGWRGISAIIATVGVSSVEGLKAMAAAERETIGSKRATDTIVGFGRPAVSRLATLVSDTRWFAQCAAAHMLGTIGSAEAVPLLHPLLRKNDPRVARAAVASLARIDDPAAARAIHTVLRSATGDLRRAVIEALVADRDPRVVPMLIRLVAESQPFGKDYEIVVETLDAMGIVGGDQAVPTLTTVSLQRRWFGRRKLKVMKEKAVDALMRIGGDKAEAALAEGANTGDRMLKKILAGRRR